MLLLQRVNDGCARRWFFGNGDGIFEIENNDVCTNLKYLLHFSWVIAWRKQKGS